MRRVRINLTRAQVAQLTPYIDRVRSAAVLGSPGMLLAQISWSDTEHTVWMEPAFLDHEQAKLVTGKGQTA